MVFYTGPCCACNMISYHQISSDLAICDFFLCNNILANRKATNRVLVLSSKCKENSYFSCWSFWPKKLKNLNCKTSLNTLCKICGYWSSCIVKGIKMTIYPLAPIYCRYCSYKLLKKPFETLSRHKQENSEGRSAGNILSTYLQCIQLICKREKVEKK